MGVFLNNPEGVFAGLRTVLGAVGMVLGVFVVLFAFAKVVDAVMVRLLPERFQLGSRERLVSSSRVSYRELPESRFNKKSQ